MQNLKLINYNDMDCISKLIQSSNLTELSNNLSNLAQLIRLKNTAKSKMLYQLASCINEYSQINMFNHLYRNPNATYFIFDERESTLMYLKLRWQKSANTRNNIIALEAIIDIINEKIIPPQGAIISNDSIHSIMAYINKEFDYSGNVLGNKPITILRFPHSDKRWNACCTTVLTNSNEIDAVISLYHGCTDLKSSPEYIYFHELGHVLQLMVTGSCKIVPESFLQIATPIFPGLDTEYLEYAPELFADCFAMGAMQDSPFSGLCPFGIIEHSHKYLFKFYMKTLINSLK